MGIALRRFAAVLASAVVVGAGVLVASPAHAAGTTISGTIKLNGADPVSGLYVGACAADCAGNEANITDAVEVGTNGSFSLTVSSGTTYALALEGLSDQPGYTDADSASVPGFGGDVYFLLPSGSTQWTVTPTFSASRRFSASSTPLSINVGQAIHNPTTVVHLQTSGTINAETCAGHTTTVSGLGAFTDLPAGGTVTYQWYTGTSPSDMVPIAGATGLSFTPPASLVGQQLLFEAVGSAPNRVAWDGLFGPLDSVATPDTCLPALSVIPKGWIKSYGKKHGTARHGKKVSVKGAKAKSKSSHLTVSYNWLLGGKVVHHGKSYKLPKSAKRKKLSVQVVFSRSGYTSRTKTLKFGKVS